MSWKLLQQQTLADAFVSEHEAIKELDELNALINWRVPLKTQWEGSLKEGGCKK
jgi:hypothetical protein